MMEHTELPLAAQSLGTALLVLALVGVAWPLLRLSRGRRFPHVVCWGLGLPWLVVSFYLSNGSSLEGNLVPAMASRGIALGLIVASMVAMGRPSAPPS